MTRLRAWLHRHFDMPSVTYHVIRFDPVTHQVTEYDI